MHFQKYKTAFNTNYILKKSPSSCGFQFGKKQVSQNLGIFIVKLWLKNMTSYKINFKCHGFKYESLKE